MWIGVLTDPNPAPAGDQSTDLEGIDEAAGVGIDDANALVALRIRGWRPTLPARNGTWAAWRNEAGRLRETTRDREPDRVGEPGDDLDIDAIGLNRPPLHSPRQGR